MSGENPQFSRDVNFNASLNILEPVREYGLVHTFVLMVSPIPKSPRTLGGRRI